MAGTQSSTRPSEVEAAGRANQKRRTRQALIEAALAMREKGLDPTFAEVAEEALVSRATAYRYFSSVEALVSESVAERAMQTLEQVYRPGDDPRGSHRACRPPPQRDAARR